MDWLQIAFDRPIYLLLLLLLPIMWFAGRKSLSGLGTGRKYVALLLRTAVLTAFVFALAEVQLVRVTDRIITLFLLDQSASVPADQRQAEFDYVRSTVGAHGDAARGDAAGVIVFGKDAHIERAPTTADFLPRKNETEVDPEHTNIADALRLAKASFPAGVSRRVVIISDGNQNLGDALTSARELAADGVGIDVAPLARPPQPDVVIDKVSAPAGARCGVPFDVSIVAEHRLSPQDVSPAAVKGRVVVTRRTDGRTELVADESVELAPGKQVFSFRQELNEPAFYTYEARFVPEDPAREQYSQNNQATAFTQIHGKGRVLFIVNAESPDEYASLIETLRAAEIEVAVQSTDALFTSLSQLQNFDGVVLADVPRTVGTANDGLIRFSDEQVDMLVRNVEQFGAGLVMLGGPNGFGAGGWANSPLEAAMPINFQVKNAEVAAVGALMLVIDKSGSMDGQKLDLSIAAAKAAVQMLGPNDHIGVIAFDTEAEDVVKLQRVGERPQRINSMINRLASGGGTNMEPGIRRGYSALQRVNASVKHLIVLTDGQTAGSGYPQLAAKMQKEGITTTAVAVGADASKNLLQEIAAKGAGKYYQAMNPKALPRIFTHETRRVVRPLIFEDAAGLQPQVALRHEILNGVEESIPPITGYVLSTLKDNPLVEVPLIAPKPAAPNNALLAVWTYGLGRTVAFTSDGGRRWTTNWTAWQDHDKLFTQMVRWSLRPIADPASFNIATQIEGGKLKIAVQALTADGSYLNGLPLRGSLVPDDGGAGTDLNFRQTGPGRYVGETPLNKTGTHIIAVQPGPRQGVLRVGVNVPYSREFRETEADENLLLSLASLQPKGSQAPGEIVRLPENPALWKQFTGPNLFRRNLPPGRLLSDVWPAALLLGAAVFLLDVFNRRVSLPLAEWRAYLARLFAPRTRLAAERDVRMERLKARRDEARVEPASARFELSADSDLSAPVPLPLEEAASAVAATVMSERAQPATDSQESYGDRLLRAKREARAEAERKSS